VRSTFSIAATPRSSHREARPPQSHGRTGCTNMDRAKRKGWSLVALDFGLATTTPTGEMVANIIRSTFCCYEPDRYAGSSNTRYYINKVCYNSVG
jgi:hypothetical protein